MFKGMKRLFRDYMQLGFVIIAILLALGLDLTGNDVLAHWVLGLTAIINVLPLLWGMIEDLREGTYGIDILAATAIITSVILGEYWAGIIIVLMLTGGEALEDYAGARAQVELTALMKRAPKKAHLLKGNRESDIAVSDIKTNDSLLIKPGEVVPVDAVIIDGSSSFDESSLTGESLPLDKEKGGELLSGSVNMEGAVTVKALRPANESQYEQIIKLVQSAAATQSPFVRLADRYAIPFTVLSFGIAGTVWVLTGDARRFLEVIVVATPCPLILGAPIALISGMSRSAKHGIIIKTGSALERLAEVRTIAFDKTGTLTKGHPVVDKVHVYNKFSEQEVLTAAAALEQKSGHILARAITEAAGQRDIHLPKVKSLKELTGHGLQGRVKGSEVLVGKAKLLEDNDISIPKTTGKHQSMQTVAYVAIDGTLAGSISFIDELREEALDTLERINAAGIKNTLMVTGDNLMTAEAIAKQLGISQVVADALPGDKLRTLEEIEDRPVAFVGDGVNDAPVLTASDVGIALGARGSTAASESADVVILLDDLSRVATAIEIAKRTFFIAKQSIFIGIVISIGLMALFATGRFQPVQGAVIQEVVDVIVIFNALRAHGSWKKRNEMVPITAAS